MPITSTPAPNLIDSRVSYLSAVLSARQVAQRFTLAGHTSIAEVSVAGSAGETAMRVLIYTASSAGLPDQVAHSRVGLTPAVQGQVYTLTFEQILLPAGVYFISVQGETTDWRWYGEDQAGYHGIAGSWRPMASASTADMAFTITDVAATPHAGLRVYRTGLHNWGIGQIGTPASEWNRAAAHRAVDPESAAIISYLSTAWGDDFLQIGMGKHKASGEDYVSHIGECNNATQRLPFMPRTQLLEQIKTGSVTLTEDEFLNGHGPRLLVPVPVNGRLDGLNGALPVQNQPGTAPVNPGSDDHWYVINIEAGELWEVYKAKNPGGAPGFGAGQFSAGVVRRYNLTQDWIDYAGDNCCSSANARGGAMVPFFFEPDDVVAAAGGNLGHALAFTQNNSYTRANAYWHPATHTPLRSPSHVPTGNAAAAMPYGAHLRLRADYPINPSWPPGLRSILTTLQLHGMVHVDGSNPGQLVATNDKLSNVGWDHAAVNLNPSDLSTLAAVRWTDFEVLAPNQKYSAADCNCRRVSESAEFVTW